MKSLSVLIYESKLLLRMFFRDRQAIFWTYLFPAGLLIIFVSLFARGQKAEIAGYMLAGVVSISVMAGGLYGIGLAIVSSREAGIFKRYKTTPLSPWIILGSHLLTRYVTIISTILMLFIIGLAVFHIQINGSLVYFLLITSVGILTFCALGFVIASFAKSVTVALSMINAVFMLMMFVGGFFPLEMLPDWLKWIARLLPATYFTSALRANLVQGASLLDSWLELSIITAFLMAFSLISVKWFHWDRAS